MNSSSVTEQVPQHIHLWFPRLKQAHPGFSFLKAGLCNLHTCDGKQFQALAPKRVKELRC